MLKYKKTESLVLHIPSPVDAELHELLLPRRHLPDVHLDAEVAARHHDAVRRLDDLFEVIERFLCLF